MNSPRFSAVALCAALASTALLPAHIAHTAPTAQAAADGTNVVINEVYGGGGNSGATYTHDFIELFNPTSAPIDLNGWTVEYFSAAGNSGGKTALQGTIPAGGHFLIQAAKGNGGTQALPSPDVTGGLQMSGSKGSVQLADAAGKTADLVGYGPAAKFEAAPAPGTSNAESVSRQQGADSDNNGADFRVGAPSPANSGTPVDPTDPTAPTDPSEPPAPAPGEVTPITEIQGTAAASPLEGKTVRTVGVVTGVWSEGGRNGFSIQQPDAAVAEGQPSPGIFVYVGSGQTYPTLGESVTVSGEVAEFYGSTQIKAATVDSSAELPSIAPARIDALPEGDAARESFEHVLIQPGTHTVTNNYALNQYGEVGLAPGTEALRQPSDVHPPSTDLDSPLQQLAADNAAKLVTLDDGRTRNYLESDTDTPLPYLAQDGAQTIKPLRTTDQVSFQHPVVVDYSHKQWRFQPTTPVTGNTAGAELPIAWEDSRPAELGAMDSVQGDYTVGAFNVLNYFTSLGEEFGGTAYEDKDGNPVTVKRGTTRGAYTQSAFEDQQSKIVAAINGLDADVVALSEIEDGYAVTGDITKRDQALAHLTEQLNAAGGNWAYVKSPGADAVPSSPDVIRTGFIYKADRVKPVGESRIFQDERFTGTAREPLAQEFAPVASDSAAASFVAVANHFKSKGSVANGDADQGDGQGNNANVRNAQAQAVLDHLGKQQDWKNKPTFVMGDLNTYTHEDALNVFRANGYSVPAETFGADPSYQFGGLLGSLDHVLANNIATPLIDDAKVWNINSDESVAFEYSRRNYNTVDFFDATPFRSSDHDPVKVGFHLGGPAGPTEPTTPTKPAEPGQPTEPEQPAEPGSSANGLSSQVASSLREFLGLFRR